MWKLKSGEVVVDRHRSHIHNGVVRLLPDALARIESKGRKFFVEEVDFGHPVGETICVSTGPGDQIVYAKRPKRWGHSRFVLNRQPEPCSSMVVVFKKAEEDNLYILITAFIGYKPEPEPWDRNLRTKAARQRSREFWANHALVWGSEKIINHTTTTDCPW